MAFAHVRSVPDYRSMELSIKFERLGQDGPFYILRDFIKNISFLSLEIESVLEYSVDPDEKLFVQYTSRSSLFVIVPVYFILI